MHTWATYLLECIITVFNSVLKVRILQFNCLKKKKEKKSSYIIEACPTVIFFIWNSKRKLVRVMFSASMMFLRHAHVLFSADDDKVNFWYGTKHIESFHRTYAWLMDMGKGEWWWLNLVRAIHFPCQGHMKWSQSCYVCISFRWDCLDYQSAFRPYMPTHALMLLWH